MGEPARVLTTSDQGAIQIVVDGIMFKAHNFMPGHSALPLRGECDSCSKLSAALSIWLFDHRELEEDEG